MIRGIVMGITLTLLLSIVFGFILWQTENKKESLHVVINEFYEGRDKPGWVELYNPTDEKINVTYWRFYVLGIYGPFIPMNYGWHYIYPHEYVLIGNNRSTLEKYWNIPKGVRCIYFPAVIAPVGGNRSGMVIEAANNLTGPGKLVDKVLVHEILPNGHSWARYVGDYHVVKSEENFTNDFYNEPNPTPGYENHRSKEGGENNGNEIYWILGIGIGVGAIVAVAGIYAWKRKREGNGGA